VYPFHVTVAPKQHGHGLRTRLHFKIILPAGYQLCRRSGLVFCYNVECGNPATRVFKTNLSIEEMYFGHHINVQCFSYFNFAGPVKYTHIISMDRMRPLSGVFCNGRTLLITLSAYILIFITFWYSSLSALIFWTFPQYILCNHCLNYCTQKIDNRYFISESCDLTVFLDLKAVMRLNSWHTRQISSLRPDK